VLRDFELEPRLVLNFCQDCKVAWCDRDEIGRIAGVSEAVSLSVTSNQAPEFAPFGVVVSAEPKCPRCADVHLVPASVLGTGVLHCSACRGNLVDLSALGKIKKAAAAARTADRPELSTVRKAEAQGQAFVSFYDYGHETIVSALAIPFAFTIGILAQVMGLSSLLFLLGGTFPHEFGHALGGWLGGYFSVPTPFWTHVLSSTSSRFISLLVSLALIACYFVWFRKGRKIGAIEGIVVRFGFIAVGAAHLKLAWMSNTASQQEVFIAMGVAGEFLLTAACVAFFCVRSVPLPRWDFWRYPVLLFGAVHFIGSWTMWGHVLSVGEAAIPWGALIGATSADGDFAKLRDLFGWTGGEILYSVQRLRMVGLAIILVCAVIQLRHFFRTKPLAPKGHSLRL
jgi:Zn-finger nucleic acid-binding protein